MAVAQSASAQTATSDRPTREPVELLLRDLRTTTNGRGQREAARRLAVYGPNALPAARHELAHRAAEAGHPSAGPAAVGSSRVGAGSRNASAVNDAALTALCERTIRNYDPCISCSAHFLDLTVVRQ